jgi:hypothetical protein
MHDFAMIEHGSEEKGQALPEYEIRQQGVFAEISTCLSQILTNQRLCWVASFETPYSLSVANRRVGEVRSCSRACFHAFASE